MQINQKQFREIIRKAKTLVPDMTSRINFYTDVNRAFTLNALTRVPFFANLDQQDKNALAFNFELKTIKKGSML